MNSTFIKTYSMKTRSSYKGDEMVPGQMTSGRKGHRLTDYVTAELENVSETHPGFNRPQFVSTLVCQISDDVCG